MPELPEVESVARSLREGLLGRRLEAIQARWAGSLRPSPATARRALVGLTLLAVDRHGKYLFLTFGDAPAGPPRRRTSPDSVSSSSARRSAASGLPARPATSS